MNQNETRLKNNRQSGKISAILIPILGVLFGLGLFQILLLPLRYSLIGLFVLIVPILVLASGQWRKFFLIGMILGIPVQVKKTVYPYSLSHFGGPGGVDIIFADFALAALYLHWIYMSVFRKQGRQIRIEGIDIVIFLLILVSVLSLSNTVEMTLGVIDLIRVIKLALLYFYLANRLRTLNDFRLVVWTLIIGVAIQATVTLAQYVLGRPLGLQLLGEAATLGQMEAGISMFRRPSGLMQSANTSGLYMISLLPLVLTTLFWSKEKLGRLLVMFTLAVGVMTLIITYSRGSWVGFLVAMPFLLYLAIKKGFLTYRRHYHITAALAIAVMILLGVMWPKIYDRLFNTPSYTVHNRTFLNRLSLAVTAEHPIVGVGLNSSAETARRIIHTVPDPHDIIIYVIDNPLVHNLYLLTLSEMGVLGLALFLAILFLLYRRSLFCIRSPNRFVASVGIAMLCFLISFSVAELFDFSYRLDQMFYLFWALTGLIVGLNRYRLKTPESIQDE